MENVIVFASGSPTGGGSGFQELVENSRTGILDANIVAVVSQYEGGGVRQKADNLGIPFIWMQEFDAADYARIVHETGADWSLLSGWVKHAEGLDSKRSVNIHPGHTHKFGGKKFYGHKVHEAVMEAYRRGEVQVSGVSMHFVTGEYDRGPVFFWYPVLIRPDDTPDSLAARVNKIEHGWQSYITNLVIHRQIHWDGKNHGSLTVPDWYTFLPKHN